MKSLFFIISLLIFFSFSSFSNESDSTEKDLDLLRCERFIKGTLKDLKGKLQDNCDLNKPFSTSLAVNIGEEHYMYCCHKKK